MIGIKVDCITKKVIRVDDGLPMPVTIPQPKPIEVDLKKVADMLKDFGYKSV